MARPRNPLVAAFVQFGFSRRDAFRLAKIQQHRIPWQLYTQGLLSVAESARLVQDWPFEGEQALLACHLMGGWKLKDAELAYLIAIQIVMNEALALDSNMPDAELMAYIEKSLIVPLRANNGVIPDQYRSPKQAAGNRAIWHDSEATQPTPGMAEAVTEIARLRSKLYDCGVDPDA